MRRLRARARTAWARLITWFNSREFSEHSILLTFAVATGVLSALGVVAFYGTIDLAYAAFYKWPATFLAHVSFLAYRPLITGAGLALAWWVMQRIGRGHDGMNVPDVQVAVVRRGADVPSRPAFARTLASAITIGAGASAGSEGPVVVLGAAIASWLGRAFRFAAGRKTVLVGCATGAAISAAFNAPLAGAFFALEEIVGTFSGASFAPVVVSSVVAAVVTRGIFGNHPAFPVPKEYGYAGVSEVLLFFPLLGLVCGAVAALYVRSYFGAGDLARRLPVPRSALPWIGGAAVGILVFLTGGVLVGYGHLAVRVDVFGRMAWYALLGLTLGKIVATSITLNFGGSGGVFTPSLYIGAAAGGTVGVALAKLFPTLGLHPETYALVGMGAMVAGATDAPITGILLVFEMTNDYAIVLPLMLTVVISHAVARRLEPDSLYSGWLRRRGESMTQGADSDVLAGLRVADACDRVPFVITEDMPLTSVLEDLARRGQSVAPVVDDAGALVGMITTTDLGRAARAARDVDSLLLAADLATPTETVGLDDSLMEAIRRMGVRGANALPVTERGTNRLLGLVSRAHVLAVYEQAVSQR